MKKPREQFELFTDEQIFNEWDNARWMCECPKLQYDLFHCNECGAEPPGGCICPQCADPVALWEK